MRVSFGLTNEKMLKYLNRSKENIDRLSTSISSGTRMTKQGDDPQAWARSITIRQEIRELGTYKKNIQFATSWNETTESSLNQMSDLVTSARNIGIAAQSVASPEKRQAQVESLNQIIQQAVSLANTQYGDQYIFSGRKTSTAPFTVVKDSEGNVTGISEYQGDEESISVRISRNTTQDVNLNGKDLFATTGTDVLQQLIDLKEAVAAGDSALIQQSLGKLEASYQHLTNRSSRVGSKLSVLETQTQILESLDLEKTSALSDISDTDISEAIIQLSQSRTVFEAVLQVTGLVANLNLAKLLQG